MSVAIYVPTRSVVRSSGAPTPLNQSSNALAIKRSGNDLENVVFQAINDASHGKTFRGIKFGSFLRNLLKNFNPSLLPLRKTRLIISSKVIDSFDNLSVPFLFPVQMKVPELIQKIFPRNESMLQFGSYFRTANINEVDAVFDLTLKNSSCPVKAVINSKNISENLTGTEYLEILNKFFKYDSENTGTQFPIHLTFCSSFSNLKKISKETISKLNNLTMSKKINFLKLAPPKNNSKEDSIVLDAEDLSSSQDRGNAPIVSFELVSLDQSVFPIHSDPKFTAIIFETDAIFNEFKTIK